MPHTANILPGGRYAVVSCHVERPLDDALWSRFSAFQQRAPGGFVVAALMRPPQDGEDETVWLLRAREAAARGPFGLHTHWTAVDHARPSPSTADPAARVREQADWLEARGLRPTLFCGGGWYIDAHVAEVVAERGWTDCTATAFHPRYLDSDATRLGAPEPCYVELPSGMRMLELPTTHSIGMLARGLLGPFRASVVHAYFHDTDLGVPTRRAALTAGLVFLAAKRTRTDLGALQRGLRPTKTMSFANNRG